MSKMPAKKKSCFQITSVTQAQVAAIGATDDTESLEDPDESRTEDVSSEIYDMSRAEYDPACDRSSSEEALNNVGELEAIGVITPSPQIPQLSAKTGNAVGEYRKVGVPGSTQAGQQSLGMGIAPGSPHVNQPGAMQQQSSLATNAAAPVGVSPNTSQAAPVTSPATPAAAVAAASTSAVSCTSRFRVIKLDHGIGEPFRRGRWTCTEFYEKDSEGSAASRTADNMRHTGATLDSSADSGLGYTGGSTVTSSTHSGQGLGSAADASHLSSRIISVETVPQQQQIHQNYGARPQSVSGLSAQSAISSSKLPAMPPQPTAGGYQSPSQNLLPVGQNGLPLSGVHMQKSPVMPPSIQHKHQQPPGGHHLTGQSEYYQQQQPTAASGGPLVPSQVGDAAGVSGQQAGAIGGVGSSLMVGVSTPQQQPGSQYPVTGQPQPHGLHSSPPSVQNVPAIAASSSVPASVATAVTSASSAVMPNVTTSGMPPGQQAPSKTSVTMGMQGLPSAVFGHLEGGAVVGGGNPEGLGNAQSPVVSGKEPAKPLMPESLQLTTPTVNSLFGIQIPVDGDADRASGTNIAAIDNKIEQAMDLVKSHLMYAVREEVEVLKEQIKELYERNSVLERENAVLKSLANSEQLSQLSSQPAAASSSTPPQQGLSQQQQQQQQQQTQQTQQQQPPLHHPNPQQQQQQQQQPPQPQQLQTPLDSGQQQPQPNVTSA